MLPDMSDITYPINPIDEPYQDADADVILVLSDDVAFRLHRFRIIARVSVYFTLPTASEC